MDGIQIQVENICCCLQPHYCYCCCLDIGTPTNDRKKFNLCAATENPMSPSSSISFQVRPHLPRYARGI